MFFSKSIFTAAWIISRQNTEDADDHTSAYVTDEGTERCHICGRDTQIAVTTPINEREGYISGVGQICPHGC